MRRILRLPSTGVTAFICDIALRCGSVARPLALSKPWHDVATLRTKMIEWKHR
jgi:hypothetical protein